MNDIPEAIVATVTRNTSLAVINNEIVTYEYAYAIRVPYGIVSGNTIVSNNYISNKVNPANMIFTNNRVCTYTDRRITAYTSIIKDNIINNLKLFSGDPNLVLKNDSVLPSSVISDNILMAKGENFNKTYESNCERIVTELTINATITSGTGWVFMLNKEWGITFNKIEAMRIKISLSESSNISSITYYYSETQDGIRKSIILQGEGEYEIPESYYTSLPVGLHVAVNSPSTIEIKRVLKVIDLSL